MLADVRGAHFDVVITDIQAENERIDLLKAIRGNNKTAESSS